jgi:signal transduction histidine kinase
MTRGPARWLPGWLRVPALPVALPRRTVRLRLAAVYATLFLVSGACLLTITYFLVDQNATQPVVMKAQAPPAQIGSAGGGGATSDGSAVRVQSVGRTLTALGGQCIAARGAAPPNAGQLTKCVSYLAAANSSARSNYLDTLLGNSAIALAAMTVAAVGIGWVTAGRVLRPLRTITCATRNISASSLHRRLALTGPDDEMKELGDTIDGLLARLEAAFDAQRQFVANASHELRTPLARQRTLVEVALAEPDQTVDRLRATCKRVLAAGEQQERLIEALLTLARSQRGLDRWEQVDLAAVVADVVDARRQEAAAQDLKVEVAADAAAVAVLGDARLAERLAANLMDNAIRHNVPGGWISVRVGFVGGQPVLRVANSGPVIPPGEVARLLTPFQRHGVGRGERRDGHGLGLSIVTAIAGAHGADLRADPMPGGGLAVLVSFPPLPAGPVPGSSEPLERHSPEALVPS